MATRVFCIQISKSEKYLAISSLVCKLYPEIIRESQWEVFMDLLKTLHWTTIYFPIFFG